ncbi:MAG: hypothetical protein RR150_05985, partial [Clostridia bacterium]
AAASCRLTNLMEWEMNTMRCSCRVCETYMVHAESAGLGCVCPACGNRCFDCLGTNTVVSREAFLAMKTAIAREDAPVEKTERKNNQ